MKQFFTFIFSAFILASPATAATIGAPAPDFTATTISGEPFKLSDHKGETVVLEWTNHLCPFVVKHYETGNMQATQKKAQDMGVTWVSLVSSAPGQQGHVSPEDAAKISQDAGAIISAKILDEDGTIGQMYDAQTTPHMFVINGDGVLVYAGAIDDQPSPSHSTVEGAHNHVLAALDDLKAGRDVQTPQSPPYGCAVKYAH